MNRKEMVGGGWGWGGGGGGGEYGGTGAGAVPVVPVVAVVAVVVVALATCPRACVCPSEACCCALVAQHVPVLYTHATRSTHCTDTHCK